MEATKSPEDIINEDALAYALYKFRIPCGSKVFFQLKHNLALSSERSWSYWFAPDVDILEIRSDNTIVAYELKGARKRKNEIGWPGFSDGLGQALAYLNLPIVFENGQPRFKGGAFDYVYLIHARPDLKLSENERRVLGLVPMIGFGIVLPDGTFNTIQEPKENPILDKEAKSHFLANSATLDKFSASSKTFRRVKSAGEPYFGG